MRTLLVVLALGALSLTACGSACQDLAERICDCEPPGSQRDTCKNVVKAQLGQSSPSDSDQKFCEATLRTCRNPSTDAGACDALRTEAGKKDCGLSF